MGNFGALEGCTFSARGEGQGREVCKSLSEGARRPEDDRKQRAQFSKPIRLINYDAEMWN